MKKIEAESNGSKVDIYICEKDSDQLPDHGMYYAVTGNGCYAHWDNGIVKGFVPCQKSDLEPYLKTVEKKATYNLPPFDVNEFFEVLSFLRESYKKHKSESCVLLFYKVPTSGLILKQETDKLKELATSLPEDKTTWSPEQVKSYLDQVNVVREKTKEHSLISDKFSNVEIDHSKSEYVLVYPKQIVTASSVGYGEEATGVTIEETLQEFKRKDPQIDGDSGYRYFKVGSIHSHPHFNAFHSSVDDSDEFDWPGLHLTIGDIMHKNFEISASIILQNTRFKLDPCDIIDGIEKVEVAQKRRGFFARQSDSFKFTVEESVLEEQNKKAIKKTAKEVAKKVSKPTFKGYLKHLNPFVAMAMDPLAIERKLDEDTNKD